MIKENRGRNSAFIIAAVNMVLSKNYNIIIGDVQEIDTSISIGENIGILKDRYTLNIPLHDIEK